MRKTTVHTLQCPVCHQGASHFLCSSCIALGSDSLGSESHGANSNTKPVSSQDSLASFSDAVAQAQLAREIHGRLKGKLVYAQYTGSIESAASNLRSSLEQSKSRLKLAQDRVQRDRIKAAAKREELRIRRARLVSAREKFELITQIPGSQHSDILQGALLNSLRGTKQARMESLARERKARIANLLELFPIDLHETGYPQSSTGHPNWRSSGTIAGVPFPAPSALNGSEHLDQSVATALALQVQVVLLASKYLGLPLPFRLVFNGSMASVGRWGNGSQDLIALDPNNSQHFKLGLLMLESDIRALCFYQGVPPGMVHREDTLHNLWQLLHSPSLGHGIRQAVASAAARSGLLNSRSGSSLYTSQARSRSNTWTTSDPHVSEYAKVTSQKLQLGQQDAATAGRKSLKQDDEADEWESIPVPVPPPPSEPNLVQMWEASGASN